jgi:hypothetical protein
MKKLITAITTAALVLSIFTPMVGAATKSTANDVAVASAAESALTSWLAHYQPTTAWKVELKILETSAAADLAKVNADIAPPVKAALPGSFRIVETTTAIGTNAQAMVPGSNEYSGQVELVVTATPAQTGVLTWDTQCFTSSDAFAQNRGQITVRFPVTKVLPLPLRNAPGGCSALGIASLNGSGSITIRLETNGKLLNTF